MVDRWWPWSRLIRPFCFQSDCFKSDRVIISCPLNRIMSGPSPAQPQVQPRVMPEIISPHRTAATANTTSSVGTEPTAVGRTSCRDCRQRSVFAARPLYRSHIHPQLESSVYVGRAADSVTFPDKYKLSKQRVADLRKSSDNFNEEPIDEKYRKAFKALSLAKQEQLLENAEVLNFRHV